MLVQLLLLNSFFVYTFQNPASGAIKPVTLRDIGVRIINGEVAEDGQFPWQVAIFGSSPSVPRYLCGGSLISEEWILTAGHCVNGATSAEIYSGSTKINSLNITISKGIEFIPHEDFDEMLLQNDIGLIRLEKPVELNEFTQPIALAEDELEPNTAVQISGWGSVSDNDPEPYSDSLMFITVSTVPNEQCQAVYGPTFITPSIVCTNTGFDAIKSPCLGDSGSPVVAILDEKPLQVATFSFVNGLGCEYPYPAGHTRTAYYRDWIKSHTGI